MVLQYIWPGCIRIPACCFTAKENDDYEKKKYEGNQTAGQKVIAGTCWNCDPWASGSVWSEYLRNNPFYQFVSGTSALDLVLSEIFMLVVSLIVGIISAGLGYMLLNISRGKEFSLGDLGYFFKNKPDRVIVAGFVLAMIQLITAIPYYYVSFTTDPGLTVDSQIQWLSMTLGLLAVSTLLNFLISLPFAMTYFLMADDTELGGIQALKERRKADEGKYLEICEAESQLYPAFCYYLCSRSILHFSGSCLIWKCPWWHFTGIWMGNWTTDCQEMELLTAAFITGPMILETDMIQKIMTVTEIRNTSNKRRLKKWIFYRQSPRNWGCRNGR